MRGQLVAGIVRANIHAEFTDGIAEVAGQLEKGQELLQDFTDGVGKIARELITRMYAEAGRRPDKTDGEAITLEIKLETIPLPDDLLGLIHQAVRAEVEAELRESQEAGA